MTRALCSVSKMWDQGNTVHLSSTGAMFKIELASAGFRRENHVYILDFYVGPVVTMQFARPKRRFRCHLMRQEMMCQLPEAFDPSLTVTCETTCSTGGPVFSRPHTCPWEVGVQNTLLEWQTVMDIDRGRSQHDKCGKFSALGLLLSKGC